MRDRGTGGSTRKWGESVEEKERKGRKMTETRREVGREFTCWIIEFHIEESVFPLVSWYHHRVPQKRTASDILRYFSCGHVYCLCEPVRTVRCKLDMGNRATFVWTLIAFEEQGSSSARMIPLRFLLLSLWKSGTDDP